RVRLEGFAVGADLERLQLDRHAAERRHVPMSQRLDREGGCEVARPTALALHRGKILSAVFVISVSKVQLESTLCRDYSTWLISSFVGALDTLIYGPDVRRNERDLHGHRFRPDRHRTDAGKGGLPEVDEDQGHRRIVPALRRVRSDREGRGGF